MSQPTETFTIETIQNSIYNGIYGEDAQYVKL